MKAIDSVGIKFSYNKIITSYNKRGDIRGMSHREH